MRWLPGFLVLVAINVFAQAPATSATIEAHVVRVQMGTFAGGAAERDIGPI